MNACIVIEYCLAVLALVNGKDIQAFSLHLSIGDPILEGWPDREPGVFRRPSYGSCGGKWCHSLMHAHHAMYIASLWLSWSIAPAVWLVMSRLFSCIRQLVCTPRAQTGTPSWAPGTPVELPTSFGECLQWPKDQHPCKLSSSALLPDVLCILLLIIYCMGCSF